MPICRDCHELIRQQPVKYSIRHYLCPDCAMGRGQDFLSKLHVWQLEQLPAIALKRSGLWDAVAHLIELKSRPRVCSEARQ